MLCVSVRINIADITQDFKEIVKITQYVVKQKLRIGLCSMCKMLESISDIII